MSDMKLLAPEEIESDRTLTLSEVPLYIEALEATVKAACERLRLVEACKNCDPELCAPEYPKSILYNTDDCPHCKGSDLAYNSWQDACRSLREDT